MKKTRRPSTRLRTGGKKGRMILVIGGGASGNSAAALALADRPGRRVFLATGQPRDHEMAERIRRHRAARGPEWEIAEVAVDLVEWFREKGAGYRTILLDCLTLWLSNLRERSLAGADLSVLTDRLLAAMRGTKARVIIVTNELGLGLIPMEAPARAFRDLAGQVNQQVAAEADEVYFVVAGRRLRLK